MAKKTIDIDAMLEDSQFKHSDTQDALKTISKIVNKLAEINEMDLNVLNRKQLEQLKSEIAKAQTIQNEVKFISAVDKLISRVAEINTKIQPAIYSSQFDRSAKSEINKLVSALPQTKNSINSEKNQAKPAARTTQNAASPSKTSNKNGFEIPDVEPDKEVKKIYTAPTKKTFLSENLFPKQEYKPVATTKFADKSSDKTTKPPIIDKAASDAKLAAAQRQPAPKEKSFVNINVQETFAYAPVKHKKKSMQTLFSEAKQKIKSAIQTKKTANIDDILNQPPEAEMKSTIYSKNKATSFNLKAAPVKRNFLGDVKQKLSPKKTESHPTNPINARKNNK